MGETHRGPVLAPVTRGKVKVKCRGLHLLRACGPVPGRSKAARSFASPSTRAQNARAEPLGAKLLAGAARCPPGTFDSPVPCPRSALARVKAPKSGGKVKGTRSQRVLGRLGKALGQDPLGKVVQS